MVNSYVKLPEGNATTAATTCQGGTQSRAENSENHITCAWGYVALPKHHLLGVWASSQISQGRGKKLGFITHRIHGAIYGNMDPINIAPLC